MKSVFSSAQAECNAAYRLVVSMHEENEPNSLRFSSSGVQTQSFRKELEFRKGSNEITGV